MSFLVSSLCFHEFDVYLCRYVTAGAPIVLLHSQTNQCLSVEGHELMNDFGKELEVCGHTSVSAGTSFVMVGLVQVGSSLPIACESAWFHK